MHTVRFMMLALLTCLCTVTVGHSQDATSASAGVDLYDTLGFNKPCTGAVKPSCSVEPATINAGTCYVWSCPDATNERKASCQPVVGSCPKNFRETRYIDGNGCDAITCTEIRGCVTKNMVRCPRGQKVSETSIDDAGCPVFSCFAPTCAVVKKCEKGFGPANRGVDEKGCPTFDCVKIICPVSSTTVCKTGEERVASGEDKDGCKTFKCDKIVCAAPKVCPTGYKSTKGATKDARGCFPYTCEKVNCPTLVEKTCKEGERRTTDTDKDGCKKYVCEKANCPAAMQCGPGSERKDLGVDTKTGCKTFKCEKIVCDPIKVPTCATNEKVKYTRDNRGCVSAACISTCKAAPTCAKGSVVTNKGLDTKGCNQYSCEKAVCKVPTCDFGTKPSATGTDAQTLCKTYKCVDVNCKPVTTVRCEEGAKLTYSVTKYGCPVAECVKPKVCPAEMTCAPGSVRKDLGKDADGCKKFSCEKPKVCPVAMACGTGTERKDLGKDADGCPKFKCEKIVCDLPVFKTCGTNERLKYTRDSRGCVTTSCVSTCPVKPTCEKGTQLKSGGVDAKGCTQYSCEKIICPTSKSCATGQRSVADGTDNATGCKTFKCIDITCKPVPYLRCDEGTKLQYTQDKYGCPASSCVTVKQCPVTQTCPAGKTAVYGKDGDGCKVVKECKDTGTQCPIVEPCAPGKTTVWGTDSKGCKIVKECKDASTQCPVVEQCAPGKTTVWGTDSKGCKIVKECKDAATQCPAVQTCPAGKTAVYGTNDKGCRVIKECKDAKQDNCPGFRETSCPSGFKMVERPSSRSGCTYRSCERDVPDCPKVKSCKSNELTIVERNKSTGCATVTCKPNCRPRDIYSNGKLLRTDCF